MKNHQTTNTNNGKVTLAQAKFVHDTHSANGDSNSAGAQKSDMTRNNSAATGASAKVIAHDTDMSTQMDKKAGSTVSAAPSSHNIFSKAFDGSAKITPLADVAHAAAAKAAEFNYIPTPRLADNKGVIKFSAAPNKPQGQARRMRENQQMSQTGTSAMAQLKAGIMSNRDNKANDGAQAKSDTRSLASVGRVAASMASLFQSTETSAPSKTNSKDPVKCCSKVAEAVAFERKHTMGESKPANAAQAQPSRRIALGDIAHEAVKKAQEFHYQPTPRAVIEAGDIVSYDAAPTAPLGKPKRMPSMENGMSDNKTATTSQARATASSSQKHDVASKAKSSAQDQKIISMAEAKAAQHAAHPDVVSLADIGSQAVKKAKHFHYKPTPSAVPDGIKNAYTYSAMPSKPLGVPKRMPSLKEAHASQFKAPQPGLMPAQKRGLSSQTTDSKALSTSQAKTSILSLADVAVAASQKAADFHPSITPQHLDSKKVVKADAKVVDALKFEKKFAPEAQSLAASVKMPGAAKSKAQVITTTTTTTIPAHMSKQPVVSFTKVDVKKPHQSMAASTNLAMKRTGAKIAAGAAGVKELAVDGAKTVGQAVKASADNLGRMARGASQELAHNAKKAGSKLSHEMEKASHGMKSTLAVAAKGAIDLGHKASDAAAIAMGKANTGMHKVAHASEVGAVKTAAGVQAAGSYIAHKANKAGNTMADDSRQIFKGAKRALSVAARKSGDIAADMGAGVQGLTENFSNGTTSAWSKTKAFFADMKHNVEASAKAREIKNRRKNAIKAEKKEIKNQQEAAAKAQEARLRSLRASQEKSKSIEAKPQKQSMAVASVPLESKIMRVNFASAAAPVQAEPLKVNIAAASAPIEQKVTTTVLSRPVQIMQPVVTRVIETKTPIGNKAYFGSDIGSSKNADIIANAAATTTTKMPIFAFAKNAVDQPTKMSAISTRVEGEADRKLRLNAMAKHLKHGPTVAVDRTTGIVENGKFKPLTEDHKMLTSHAAKGLMKEANAALDGEEIVKRKGGFTSIYHRHK